LAPLPPLTPLIGTTRTPSVSADGVSAKAKAPASKQAEAFRQFESFILQSFIETMLPKNAESVFGKGTAGGVWKSMLAEKLADQISRSGGIGIAQKIAGPQVASAPPATRGGGAAEAASASATQPLDHLPLIRTYRSGEPS
jgi:flagellar protein FlgJ